MIYNKSNESCEKMVDSMDYEKMSKKLLPPSCLFCVNSSTNVKKFKISKNYDGVNTIREDLITFLGYEIEGYLNDNDFLCSNCMNFFENMVIMKGNLIKFLKARDESVDKKMKTFNYIWKMFTKFAGTLVKLNPINTEETWDLENITRSQTPNPMMFKYAVSSTDTTICRDDYSGSTTASEGNGRDNGLDNEVEQLCEKGAKKKKRGYNWTRRKGEQKSRALSRSYSYNAYMNSDNQRGCYSADYRRQRPSSSANCSTTSGVRSSSKRKKRTVEGKPLRTRSVSRSENLKANVMVARESNKFYCSDLSCDQIFINVDNLASHKVQYHGIIPRFSCSQCWKTYTTRNELDIHNKVHESYSVHCFQCGTGIKGSENLQLHLKKHLEYSIECRYCSFSFLSKDELKQHCSQQHQQKEKRRYDRKKSNVLKSICNPNKIKSTSIYNNNASEKNFQPRILLNNSTPHEVPIDTSPLIVRSIVPDICQVSSAITISDSSPCEMSSASPIAISDVSSSIVFTEVQMSNMDMTPTNQISSSILKNPSCNISPEVQIMENIIE